MIADIPRQEGLSAIIACFQAKGVIIVDKPIMDAHGIYTPTYRYFPASATISQVTKIRLQLRHGRFLAILSPFTGRESFTSKMCRQ